MRVVGQAVAFEGLEDSADLFIDQADHVEVGGGEFAPVLAGHRVEAVGFA